MRLVLVHARYGILQNLRLPIAVVPTTVFPALAFVLFGVPNVGDDPIAATFATIALSSFGIMLVVLFQFGADIAEDREKPWDQFERVLPVGNTQRVAARLVVALVFSLLSAIPVWLIAWAATPASIPAESAGWVLLGIFGGAVPLALLGIGIGYSVPVKAAVALANILFFPLAFVGGMFLPPDMLPGWVRPVSQWAPSRNWLEVASAPAVGAPLPIDHLLRLVGWSIVFGAFAVWAYRRDEGRRFK